MSKQPTSAIKLKSPNQKEWIRNYLFRKKENGDYVSSIWVAWNDHKKKETNYKSPCTYTSFRKTIFDLYTDGDILRVDNYDYPTKLDRGEYQILRVYYVHPDYVR